MAGNKNLAEDPYERLANAIILQAVADYRVALKKIKAHPKDRKAKASGRSETIRVNPREKK